MNTKYSNNDYYIDQATGVLKNQLENYQCGDPQKVRS
jgi:hypothetical protein